MAKKILGDDPFGGSKSATPPPKPTKPPAPANTKVKRAPAAKTEAPRSARVARPGKPKSETSAAPMAVVEASVPTTTQALAIVPSAELAAPTDAAPGSWRWWRFRQLRLAEAQNLGWLARADRADRFGRDPELASRAEPVVDFVYRSWLHVVAKGLGHVPESGRAILVARRRGRPSTTGKLRGLAQAGLSALGWGTAMSTAVDSALDAALIRHAMRSEHVAHRDVRPLVHPQRIHAPVVGSWLRRLGGVSSDLHHFARLLDDDGVALAFVGDDHRDGALDLATVVAMALVTGAPMVPVHVEHGRSLVGRGRVTLDFGTPMFLGEEYGADGADDAALLEKVAADVAARL